MQSRLMREHGINNKSNPNLTKGECVMKKYECEPCGYIYDEAAGDPDNGIAPGTKWENLPEDWVCPVCGLGKDVFKEA